MCAKVSRCHAVSGHTAILSDPSLTLVKKHVGITMTWWHLGNSTKWKYQSHMPVKLHISLPLKVQGHQHVLERQSMRSSELSLFLNSCSCVVLQKKQQKWTDKYILYSHFPRHESAEKADCEDSLQVAKYCIQNTKASAPAFDQEFIYGFIESGRISTSQAAGVLCTFLTWCSRRS